MGKFDMASLPGGDLVKKGLEDLQTGARTEESLLVQIARYRLREHGFSVPEPPSADPPCEHLLYEMLEERLGSEAYGRYNSLIARMVSFENAAESLTSSRI